MNEILKNLDLTEKQIKVYLALLKVGKSKVNVIMAETELKRSTVYEVLEQLINKGLIVEYSADKVKQYASVSATELVSIYDKKLLDLKKILPELEKLSNNSFSTPALMSYKGQKGVKNAYMTVFGSKDKEILSIAANRAVKKEMSEEWVNNYVSSIVENKIHFKTITYADQKIDLSNIPNIKKFREEKTVPRSLDFEADILIFDKTIVFISFGNVDNAVKIESEMIANALKAMFNLLWERIY